MEELLILGRMAEKDRLKDRRLWMVLGILLCSVLLVGIGWLMKNGENERFAVVGNSFNMRNSTLFFGVSYPLYKSMKEIHHKPEGPDTSGSLKKDKPQSFWALMAQIIIIDAVFSFDSIITVIGQAKHVEIMIAAVISPWS
jgi:predicted tellurium resistance membrane protein TerC